MTNKQLQQALVSLPDDATVMLDFSNITEACEVDIPDWFSSFSISSKHMHGTDWLNLSAILLDDKDDYEDEVSSEC